MPNMTNKQDLIAYFAEKSQRSAKDGGTYFETVNEMLLLFDQMDDVAEIKAVVRNLHREKLKEIQRTESSEARIELRVNVKSKASHALLAKVRHLLSKSSLRTVRPALVSSAESENSLLPS